MKLKRFFEFKKSDLEPVKSFKIQDELNPKIWDDMKMKKEIREDLLKISEDFFEGTELDAEVKDIILTGSLANYNWSKYSDHDLHIIIDFKDINDDEDLVKDLVDSKKTIWNLQHDIEIGGYEVEVYIQDEKEPHTSTGVYSILNDKWNVKPEKKDFEPNEKEIEKKGISIMKQVDKIEEDWENLEYEEVKKRVKKVWEKIKKLRKDGLKKGEFGTGNLVFKLLRRNNYIGKIMDIKKNAYAKQFEYINEKQTFSFFQFDDLSDGKLDEVFGFNREDVEDTLQDIIDEYDFPISINFNINNGYMNDKQLNEIEIKKKTCEIHFFIDAHLAKKMLYKLSGSKFVQPHNYYLIQDEINKIEEYVDFIENKFRKGFFENMGYEVKIIKRKKNQFINNLNISRIASENVEYSNTFLNIYINDINQEP